MQLALTNAIFVAQPICLNRIIIILIWNISIFFQAKLTSLATILCMSAADLERATKLSFFDIAILLKAVSYSLPCPPSAEIQA